MNNYQWLLEMDGAERKAWFDAEREEPVQLKDMFGILGDLPTDPGEASIAAVEGFVREHSNDAFQAENVVNVKHEHFNDANGILDGNTDAVSERYATAFKWLDRLNYGKGGDEPNESVMPAENVDAVDNEDSREQLEADVREVVEAYNMDAQRHGTERFADELYHSIIHLLDRQAAITQHEITERWAEHLHPIERKCGDLRRKVDELTVERDYWKELNEYHAFQYDQASDDIDRLTAENAELVAENDALTKERSKLYEERGSISGMLLTASKERDRYRDLFEMALDWGHEITMLGTSIDEGMA